MFTVSAEGSEVEAKGRMQLATLLHSINLQAAKTGTKKGNIFNKGSIQAGVQTMLTIQTMQTSCKIQTSWTKKTFSTIKTLIRAVLQFLRCFISCSNFQLRRSCHKAHLAITSSQFLQTFLLISSKFCVTSNSNIVSL